MQPIVLGRIAHLLAYTDVLRGIGAPVDRELRRAGMPTMLDCQPDAYFPLFRGLGVLQSMERSQGIDDLGFEAARKETFSDLGSDLRIALKSTQTLYARLKRFGSLVPSESSHCRVSLIREGSETRICHDLVDCPRLDELRFSEWIQIIVLVGIIRDAFGAAWSPTEITFRSRFSPSDDAFEYFPNSRIATGEKVTSIKFPSGLLSQPLSATPNSRRQDDSNSSPTDEDHDFPRSLKLALRAYVGEVHPGINLAAEISGCSVRTIQRRLAESGLSYSALVDEVRFEAAVELLDDPDIKLLDVASSVGYSDPSNFSRAFRRIAGVSPREYRQQP